MCGLVGFLNFDRRFAAAEAESITREMAASIRYRGPDMDGFWSSQDNLCHFGHKRLSIIDLTEDGRQPMLDDTGRYAITFNGEIYNYQTLREQLAAAGISFRTKTDTEVLLKGFIRFGTNLFPMLDGMFALAIHDSVTGATVFARDRAGEKPLYIRRDAGLLTFASELHALTKVPGLDWDLSANALASYMLYRYVPAPGAILHNVEKLPPGCFLRIDRTGLGEVTRYFVFETDPEAEISQNGFAQTCERVEAGMVEAIRHRLLSDVPLGMFLSSGVDSALVCAIAVGKLGVTPRTFTIGFEGDPGSEHIAAREIAQHLGTQHSDHVFSAADFDNVGRNMGALLDEPNGDRSCVPTYLLCKYAREQVTVALSGDGGDEMFAGYDRYGSLATTVAANPGATPAAIVDAYYNQFLPVFGFDAAIAAFPEAKSTLAKGLDHAQILFQHPGRSTVESIRQLDFATYMPGAVLAKVDRMSMRSSLEVRTPFFHPALLAESSRLPNAYSMQSGGTLKKLVLREILARNLPEAIRRKVAIDTPKKGFGMPASVFLNNQAAVQQEMHRAFESLAGLRFFQARKQSLKSMADHATRNINAAWSFIVLGQWAAAFPARL
ncbi:asparagine synthase (glutamine-hydrolyzing) [Dongia sp.]|uniref:asparagine synthase (glutamine-hydrolyzing) n=1 Tax=Dongia sp. TaxID=1977262 RepID=UPI0035B19A5C